MATRAALAAKDRRSREAIAEKDRNWDKSKFKEENRRKWFEANSQHLKNSAGATKDLSGAASSISKLMNDPEWYKRYGYDPYAAALPDFYRIGSRLFPRWRDNIDDDAVIPGVMVFTYQDTLPNQNETNVATSLHYQNSPINISLTRFMANLRKLNSRIGDYDPADLGLYWYAVRSYVTVLAMLAKAISIYNTYYATNAYFAKIMIEAAGFDYDDFASHIAEYKLLCQKHVNLFNANAVIPNQLSFILRGLWLASTLIKDHEGDHSQIYMFRPYSFGHLNIDEDSVVYSKVEYPVSYSTISNRLTLDSNNLFNSTGVVTMMADLRAAFGDAVMQFKPDLDASAQFSSSKHDLEQIHNLRTLPIYWDNDNDLFATAALSKLNIYQDSDGFLKQGDSSSTTIVTWSVTFEDMSMDDLSISAAREYEYLDFYDEESCTPDMYLEATRLRVVLFTAKATGLSGRLIKYNGTEVVVNGTIYTTDPSNPNAYKIAYYGTDIAIDLDNGDVSLYASQLAKFTTFDWLPLTRVFFVRSGFDTLLTWCDFGEVDHAVTLPQQNLKWLHELATLSEFFTDPVSPGRK